MKKVLLLGVFAFLLFSCSNEELVKSSSSDLKLHFTKDNPCNEATYDLIAGQHIDVGTVSVSNDDEYLYISYETTGDWYITETHVYVGADEDIPLNSQGNPHFGHFPYSKDDHDSVQYYELDPIPLSELDDCFSVVMHAAVNRIVNGEVLQDETAFGCGDMTFPGNRWGCYFQYCVEECEDECMPAIAYHDGCGFCTVDDGGATYTNEINYNSLLSWGSIAIDLYTNVDGCDLSGGERVGYLKVSIADAATGLLKIEPYVNSGFEPTLYRMCSVEFYLSNDPNEAVNDTNYVSYNYDSPTNSPDSFYVTWPDTSQNIYIRGGATVELDD